MAKVPDIFGGHLHTAVGAPHASAVEFAGPVIDLECKRSATRGDPRGILGDRGPRGNGLDRGFVRSRQARRDALQPLEHDRARRHFRVALAVQNPNGSVQRSAPSASSRWTAPPPTALDELEDFVQAIRRNERLFLAARPPDADLRRAVQPRVERRRVFREAAVLQRTPFTASLPRCGGRASTSTWSARRMTSAATRSSISPCRGWSRAPTCRNLIQYVDDGGTVCAEAGFACLEDNGWYAPRVPRMGLSEKLGYQEREVVYDTTGEIHTAYGTLGSAGEPRHDRRRRGRSDRHELRRLAGRGPVGVRQGTLRLLLNATRRCISGPGTTGRAPLR